MAVNGIRARYVKESKAAYLRLSREEADLLNSMGRQLASDKTSWRRDEPRDEEPDAPTVIRCTPTFGDLWQVVIDNAVGSVMAGDLHLIVEPKIPTPELLHLFSKTEAWPRLQESIAPLAEDETLLDVLARWFLGCVERLLRSELLRDYSETRDDLDAVRGRIDVLSTARLIYSGRLSRSPRAREQIECS
jgi:hypothetical protein